MDIKPFIFITLLILSEHLCVNKATPEASKSMNWPKWKEGDQLTLGRIPVSGR